MNEHPSSEFPSSIGQHELAAIGGISCAWNAFEYQCYQLLALIGRMNFEKSYILVHDLKTPAILTRIIALAEYCDFEEAPESTETIDALSHLSRFASICRENRNNLIHSIPVGGGQRREFVKLRGIQYSPAGIEIDVSVLNRIEDDILALITYANCILAHISGSRLAGAPTPLPDKPPLPSKLNHLKWSVRDQGQPESLQG